MPKSWSYSALGMFDVCQKKYEIIRHKKLVVDPPGKAADEGTRIHSLIENYLMKGEWDDDLYPYKRLLDSVKVREGVCEEGYHFKRRLKYPEAPSKSTDKEEYTLERCEADDPECWLRSYIDWIKIDGDKAEIIDWKTGRVKPTDQLQFYAWLVMTAHPEVNSVKVTFHWINKKDQLSQWFERKDMDRLYAPFKGRLELLDRAIEMDVWLEIENSYCKYCPVTKEHCSHGN